MYTFLICYIIVGLGLSLFVKKSESKIIKDISRHIVGFSIYYALFGLIILILLYSPDKIFSVNDFFTSIFLIVGILISFGIFLSNREIVPANRVVDYIAKIPHHVPFSHAIKNYLFSLLRVNYKVKVLLKTPNGGNYKWILYQIAAYNEIFKKNGISQNLKESIEFILLDNNESEIEQLFKTFDTDRYNYIVITSLSAIFKEAIISREKLNKGKPRVKIIGALSSVSNDHINKIINRDENIIRVFPPDYDEANTAINFIFYRIISRVCSSKICDYHNTKSNVIVLHSGSYGSAISRQCKALYISEKKGLKYFTNNEVDNKLLIDNISYYSFNFTENREFINDSDESTLTLQKLLIATRDDQNWFYIVGYEPNISNMIEVIDSALLKAKSRNSYFLFCGTSTMNSWRKSILDKINTLESIKDKEAYYLKLKFCNPNTEESSKTKECELKFKYKKEEGLDIEDVINRVNNIDIDLTQYCGLDENYISILTKDSLKIAKEVIDNPEMTLLSAKYSILNDEDSDIKILVNGDSINQYEIDKMK